MACARSGKITFSSSVGSRRLDPRMAVIRSGSRRSPRKRSVANAVFCGASSVDFVIDVANYRTDVICHRAVIPYGDAIPDAQPGPSFDTMQGLAHCGRVMPRVRLTSFGGF